MVQRRVAITGAASGLGKAISLDLAKQGAILYLVDLPGPNLKTVAEECKNLGAKVFEREADITKDYLNEVASQANELMNGVDTVISCAGIYRPSLMSQDTMTEAQKVIDVNLTGNMNTANAFAPYLIKNKSSNLIILSSLAAKRCLVGMGAYSASKAGITSIAKAAFEELRGAGVKVTSVMPGFIKSPMTQMDTLDQEKVMDTKVITDTINYIMNFDASGCPTEIVIENQISPMINQ